MISAVPGRPYATPLLAARGADLLTGKVACYQIYRTADACFVALGAIEEKFWRTFCLTVERPDWLARQLEPLLQQQLIAELQEVLVSRPANRIC